VLISASCYKVVYWISKWRSLGG